MTAVVISYKKAFEVTAQLWFVVIDELAAKTFLGTSFIDWCGWYILPMERYF